MPWLGRADARPRGTPVAGRPVEQEPPVPDAEAAGGLERRRAERRRCRAWSGWAAIDEAPRAASAPGSWQRLVLSPFAPASAACLPRCRCHGLLARAASCGGRRPPPPSSRPPATPTSSDSRSSAVLARAPPPSTAPRPHHSSPSLRPDSLSMSTHHCRRSGHCIRSAAFATCRRDRKRPTRPLLLAQPLRRCEAEL